VEVLEQDELLQRFADRRRVANDLAERSEVREVPRAAGEQPEVRATRARRGLAQESRQRREGDPV